jgi:hypothetical protein
MVHSEITRSNRSECGGIRRRTALFRPYWRWRRPVGHGIASGQACAERFLNASDLSCNPTRLENKIAHACSAILARFVGARRHTRTT